MLLLGPLVMLSRLLFSCCCKGLGTTRLMLLCGCMPPHTASGELAWPAWFHRYHVLVPCPMRCCRSSVPTDAAPSTCPTPLDRPLFGTPPGGPIPRPRSQQHARGSPAFGGVGTPPPATTQSGPRVPPGSIGLPGSNRPATVGAGGSPGAGAGARALVGSAATGVGQVPGTPPASPPRVAAGGSTPGSGGVAAWVVGLGGSKRGPGAGDAGEGRTVFLVSRGGGAVCVGGVEGRWCCFAVLRRTGCHARTALCALSNVWCAVRAC